MLRLLAALVAGILVVPAVAQNQQPIGETIFARGAATAQVGENVRLIGKGAPIFEGDVLSTGGKSFAIVKFDDGTRMTLRPDSVFQVRNYNNEGDEPVALMRLFKGGFRALTGLVSKLNPLKGFKVQTTLATIGIRGTDFSARICDQDCIREAQQIQQRPPSDEFVEQANVAARVAFLRGRLTGQTSGGETRNLVTGGAVYEGDTLETGANSIAVLAFRDESRVTMQADTIYRITAHRLNEERPQDSWSFSSLLKGGLRIVTGLIGQVNAPQFQVDTPVATIGIRGTKFDLMCQGLCAGDNTAQASPPNLLGRVLDELVPPAQAAVPTGDGLYILTREGELYAERDGQVVELPEGESIFMRNILRPPELGVDIPTIMLQNLGPAPEEVDVPENYFDVEALPADKEGLIVAVYDEGHATVEQADGTTLHLGKNEAVHTTGSEMLNVQGGPPPVVREDPYNFRPNDFTGSSLLDASGLPNVRQQNEPLECKI